MVDIFIVDGQNVEDVELQLVKCRESLRGYARTQIQTPISGIRYSTPTLSLHNIYWEIVESFHSIVWFDLILAIGDIHPIPAVNWKTWQADQDRVVSTKTATRVTP